MNISTKNRSFLSFRPEEEALISCSKTTLSMEKAKEAACLFESKDFDWNYFYSTARHHGVIPLIYKNLKDSGLLQTNRDFTERCRKDSQFNSAHNVLLTSQLESLLQLLTINKILALPIKGPALAVQAYKDLSLRCFVDLDVICQKDDVLNALEVLRENGYQIYPKLSPYQIKLILKRQYNLQLTHQSHKAIVELHWHIVPPNYLRNFSASIFWDNTANVKLNSMFVQTLSPEAHLILICVHGSKHYWERLNWICDVAEMLRTYPALNWDSIYSYIKSKSVESMVHLGLLLASNILKAPMPETVLQQIKQNPHVLALESNICSRLFSGQNQNYGFSLLKSNLKLRYSWRDKVAFFRYLIAPTEKDLSSYSLPPHFEFAYYGLRPYRLLTKFNKLPDNG